MEFGEMKRNTSNWRNFCMLLRRAGLTASAGLSCHYCTGNSMAMFKNSDNTLRQFVQSHSVLVPTATVGHFTFWLRPWLSLLAETKH